MARLLAQPLTVFLLSLFTLFSLTPIIWAVMISLKQPADAFSIPPRLLFEPTFRFHYEIWAERRFVEFFLNSAIIALGTVFISVPLGTLAAYGLSRLESRLSRSYLMGLLVIRMFPHILLLIPFFIVARSLSLIDTYPAMIAAMVAINQPFTVWLMRSFFLEIPRELDEAATIDGCNAWTTFTKVILPLAKPGIVVTSLFSLLLAYNEFLFALILTGGNTKTLPVAIAEYGGEDLNYWSLSAAGAIGIMLPILLFMLFFQRHLVRGLTIGAVKG
ncbi:carbohydrate ABC transporter permease [Bosea sp. BK604]|uniref:carbohydrate ABC transporter permease n=1 Tax=Bosea sp. BK604 TaxID=2512180 RepID=UPI00105328E9|nr:carbohydrate ABC transporter permease [Bosea sp. BK604]TCR67533.1 carbohydrate ABC transporter membrane protein 2 (CUT1 family) [Bosea sp. BK604]